MQSFTFDELMTELFTERWSSQDTQYGYGVSVRALQKYIKTNYPDEVTEQQVYAWRAAVVRRPGRDDGICEVSWNTYTRHLKALYNFGMARGYLSVDQNPFKKVGLKPPKLRTKTLPDGAITKIRKLLEGYERAEEAGKRGKTYIHPAWFWATVVEMLYHTGIRLRQLLCIKLHDIDIKGERFICSAEGAKNSSESILPLHHDLVPLLARLVDQSTRRGAKPSDQLFNVNRFSIRHGRATMNTSQVSAFFRRLSDKIGVKVSPHRFRHSFATDLMTGERADIHLTQLLMCHSDVRSTMIYVDVPVARLKHYLLQRTSGQDTVAV